MFMAQNLNMQQYAAKYIVTVQAVYNAKVWKQLGTIQRTTHSLIGLL